MLEELELELEELEYDILPILRHLIQHCDFVKSKKGMPSLAD